MILSAPDEWSRTILLVGPHEYVREMEGRFLTYVDAAGDEKSFNRHNSNGKFSTTGKKLSAEHREKILAALRGRKMSDETKAKIGKANGGENNYWFGRTHSAEQKEKIRQRMASDANPSKRPDVKKKLSEMFKGRKYTPMTDEQKVRHAKAVKDALAKVDYTKVVRDMSYMQTPEYKAKLSAGLKASDKNKNRIRKPHSEETKAKMRKPRSEEAKANMKKARPIVLCPHCDKSGDRLLMLKWHFDNCKLRK